MSAKRLYHKTNENTKEMQKVMVLKQITDAQVELQVRYEPTRKRKIQGAQQKRARNEAHHDLQTTGVYKQGGRLGDAQPEHIKHASLFSIEQAS